ncbi:precorrin-8X methylmutase [Roseospira marina]|uniref:Precorrin-8X methylmutase n=1 Tax=Roseospira marina TaxID=140057 RepID=A0A5M6I7J8_9PROT|nr:precorrin-8X methylmutase [Roseospira marina]KAA5604113.1 precorrin-8X methylmutase [Roseospira marina]MBB4315784.1 precorrin-8X/cobalt-precorrin-8 methylmutase [Roseospira marina]MBB5088977.1 precorrin-8X/cobalt-precorrin-8 methylmutase [Roseospira marina]
MTPNGTLPPYERRPDVIRRTSYAAIAAEADLSAVPTSLHALATRVIHACGMVDILAEFEGTETAAAAGREAMEGGAPILVDTPMVARGIIPSRARPVPVVCRLGDNRVPDLAEALGTTRSAAAVDLWVPMLDGAVVAIGTAPTALFRLLELLSDGAPRPALILGFPVGFIGAEDSKHALAAFAPRWGVPFVTLHGRRGGPAMAAAAVNALALASDGSNDLI